MTNRKIKEKYSASAVLRRSWELVRPYRRNILFGVFCAFLGSLVTIVSTNTQRYLVDDILPNGNMAWLWPIQFIFVGSVLIDCLCTLGRKYLFSQASQKGQADLRNRMFRRLLDSSYLARTRKTDAQLLSSINYQVNALSGVLENGIPSILVSTIDILVTLIVMLALDWRLTLLSAPVYPVLFFASKFLRGKVEKIQERYQSALRDMTEVLSDATACADNIETYQLDRYIAQRFADETAAVRRQYVALDVLYQLMGLFSWWMIMVPYQAILYGVGGTWLIHTGAPTIGMLLIFANFTNHLIQPVMQLMNVNNGIGAAQSAFQLLDSYDESLPARPQVQYPAAPEEAVARAASLTYAYPGQPEPILNGLSAYIARGEFVVLWGGSGHGKSTLLKILARQLPLQETGMLSINPALRWGYFPQEPQMFRLSLLENFRLVRPGISQEEVWSLLRAFSVDEAVRRHPEGLSFLMNRSSGQFSLGEFRRLCLAVFWAADFDVLLLDEPTASLDAANAQAIAQALEKLNQEKDKTLIIASHDPTLRKLANHVIAFGGAAD